MLHDLKTLAAIDVGTNSFHLIIAKILEGQKFSVIAKEKAVVRLGESPSQIKKLSPEAIRRGVEAMKIFAMMAAQAGSPIRAVATSAVREATNRDEFIQMVAEQAGIEIEVVSGFEEARLIYLGILQALPVFNDRVALFDIGGGSTEFLIGERGKILYANSFKIGAIRMTQRFFPNERVSESQIEQCRLFIRGEIYHAAHAIRASGAKTLVASSGTAQTIAAMALAARGETVPESLNGVRISRAEARQIVERVIKAKSHRDRAALPGVDPRRADILAAGAVELETILCDCDFQEFVISSYALREGIVLDTIHKLHGSDGMAHLSDLRYETVMKIGRMYNFNEAHARHVADLALQIYDDLSPLHRLDEDSRELLEAAALLHDIGYYISHSSHHKHTFYLIQNSEALGFTNDEIAVIANVARYHRKSHPKKSHPQFAVLPPQDQARVRYLSAILRVADGFDRTHKRVIESIETLYDASTISFRLNCRPETSPAFEVWSVNRKKGLMEECFGREVAIPEIADVDLVGSLL